MLIYCDIIEPQIVGSALVPLLRMVNIIGNEGRALMQTFNHPFYLPISLWEFQSCCATSLAIPIDKGQVTLTLHFRK